MAGQEEPEFYIQIAEVEEGAASMEDGSGRLIKGSRRNIEAAAAVADLAAERLGGIFKGAGPSSGSVEFALSFEGAGGVPVFATGKIGASITVTLNWGK